mmetsp:Transcript_14279/g.33793  ORF Transcript_14279/g.33793 Transcript_14279/m.33793 type:complete len:345 (+) Transcript_14279:295-1329(+)
MPLLGVQPGELSIGFSWCGRFLVSMWPRGVFGAARVASWRRRRRRVGRPRGAPRLRGADPCHGGAAGPPPRCSPLARGLGAFAVEPRKCPRREPAPPHRASPRRRGCLLRPLPRRRYLNPRSSRQRRRRQQRRRQRRRDARELRPRARRRLEWRAGPSTPRRPHRPVRPGLRRGRCPGWRQGRRRRIRGARGACALGPRCRPPPPHPSLHPRRLPLRNPPPHRRPSPHRRQERQSPALGCARRHGGGRPLAGPRQRSARPGTGKARACGFRPGAPVGLSRARPWRAGAWPRGRARRVGPRGATPRAGAWPCPPPSRPPCGASRRRASEAAGPAANARDAARRYR